MIRIGYACINTHLPTSGKTFRLQGYSLERMLGTARANLKALEDILFWNLQHDIRLFRMTSDLIPFGSHPVNSGQWQRELAADLRKIGQFIQTNAMRVSLHPGQYTILNSPNPVTYQNALEDLQYHSGLLNLMGLPFEHKIILHAGGVYGNKSHSTAILIERLQTLSESLNNRMALENDEKSYNAADILAICQKVKLPAVLDVFHHQVNPGLVGMSPAEIIAEMNGTWRGERQKIHYSNQAEGKSRGAHSETIQVEAFKQFFDSIKDMELDIMLEVKDKQASVLKLRHEIVDLK
jgi:UV DNA damage endonuclease